MIDPSMADLVKDASKAIGRQVSGIEAILKRLQDRLRRPGPPPAPRLTKAPHKPPANIPKPRRP